MEFINEALSKYCELHSEPESDLLKELNRQTHLKVMSPRMLSGHLQGRFLSTISKLKQPKRILEIGTYTGYSALCLAEGLSADGLLFTIDPNEETNTIANSYFDRSSFSNQIKLFQGDAIKLIPEIDETFDLVFIDADKKNYKNYYDLVIGKVNTGGLILIDNVLWSGKVLEMSNQMDVDTKIIHQLNEFITHDQRVSNLLLPIRDGLMLVVKK